MELLDKLLRRNKNKPAAAERPVQAELWATPRSGDFLRKLGMAPATAEAAAPKPRSDRRRSRTGAPVLRGRPCRHQPRHRREIRPRSMRSTPSFSCRPRAGTGRMAPSSPRHWAFAPMKTGTSSFAPTTRRPRLCSTRRCCPTARSRPTPRSSRRPLAALSVRLEPQAGGSDGRLARGGGARDQGRCHGSAPPLDGALRRAAREQVRGLKKGGPAGPPFAFRKLVGRQAAASSPPCTGPESCPRALTSRSTNSMTAIGALSP
jgi:hypothetical protein